MQVLQVMTLGNVNPQKFLASYARYCWKGVAAWISLQTENRPKKMGKHCSSSLLGAQ